MITKKPKSVIKQIDEHDKLADIQLCQIHLSLVPVCTLAVLFARCANTDCNGSALAPQSPVSKKVGDLFPDVSTWILEVLDMSERFFSFHSPQSHQCHGSS